jgi:hypothetical protein
MHHGFFLIHQDYNEAFFKPCVDMAVVHINKQSLQDYDCRQNDRVIFRENFAYAEKEKQDGEGRE